MSFVGRQGEAGAGETRRFTGDEGLSAVRSMTMFSSGVAGRLRLRKPSRGPRPLTKGGPLCAGSAEDSFSLSLSDTAGSGQACAQGRLGGWFSFGSGFKRLNGRRAADTIKKKMSHHNGYCAVCDDGAIAKLFTKMQSEVLNKLTKYL